jgi:microcystin-dependent protein
MDNFLGSLLLVPYNFAPAGWAFCNGQLLPIAQHTALFSLLGTTYRGDGKTTFALPDLRGRVPVSSGQGVGLQNYNLGQTGGAESETLAVNQLPSHNHSVNTVAGPAHIRRTSSWRRAPRVRSTLQQSPPRSSTLWP